MGLKVGDYVRVKTLYSPVEAKVMQVTGVQFVGKLSGGKESVFEVDHVIEVLGNELDDKVVCFLTHEELFVIEQYRRARLGVVDEKPLRKTPIDDITFDHLTITGTVKGVPWSFALRVPSQNEVEENIAQLKHEMDARDAVV